MLKLISTCYALLPGLCFSHLPREYGAATYVRCAKFEAQDSAELHLQVQLAAISIAAVKSLFLHQFCCSLASNLTAFRACTTIHGHLPRAEAFNFVPPPSSKDSPTLLHSKTSTSLFLYINVLFDYYIFFIPLIS